MQITTRADFQVGIGKGGGGGVEINPTFDQSSNISNDAEIMLFASLSGENSLHPPVLVFILGFNPFLAAVYIQIYTVRFTTLYSIEYSVQNTPLRGENEL